MMTNMPNTTGISSRRRRPRENSPQHNDYTHTNKVLDDARTLHALNAAREMDADLQRLKTDPDYANAIAGTLYGRGLVGMAQPKFIDGIGSGACGSDPASRPRRCEHPGTALVDRRPALQEPVERSGAGVFRRWDHR